MDVINNNNKKEKHETKKTAFHISALERRFIVDATLRNNTTLFQHERRDISLEIK